MRSLTKTFSAAAALACVGLLTAAGPAPEPVSPASNHLDDAAEKNIVETAQAAGSFDTLLKAATAAGLAETLATKDGLTVFAPTDEAFAKLPEGALEGLLADKEQLKAVLLYHVVAGEVMAKDVVGLDGKQVETLSGKKVRVKVKDGAVMLGKAKVVKTDIKASNGVIHVIDTVLLPPKGKKVE